MKRSELSNLMLTLIKDINRGKGNRLKSISNVMPISRFWSQASEPIWVLSERLMSAYELEKE